MQVKVLGASPVRPNPGRACSGYLLDAGGRLFLVDCGSGVLAAFLEDGNALADLDAILISHAHPDHCLDLVSVRQALAHVPVCHRDTPLPVYVGPGSIETIQRLGAAFGDGAPGYWAPWMDLRVFDADAPLDLADVSVRFAPTSHYVPCWAMRFEHEGRVWVYTADTGPAAPVSALADGAHLLIGEATLLTRAGNEGVWGHMSAAEAGQMAAAAGAEHLLLTHYFVELGPDQLVAAARRSVNGARGVAIEIAREGEVYDV